MTLHPIELIFDHECIEVAKKLFLWQSLKTVIVNLSTIDYLLNNKSTVIHGDFSPKNILIGIATSITPNGKTSIIFEKLIESKDNPLGRKCIIPEGQKILDQLVEKYKNINDIIILSSTENKFFVKRR